jgi:hypothetical protein
LLQFSQKERDFFISFRKNEEAGCIFSLQNPQKDCIPLVFPPGLRISATVLSPSGDFRSDPGRLGGKFAWLL